MDKLKAVEAAIAEILEDDRVSPEGEGYRVRNVEGAEFLVLPIDRGDWAIFFGSSTPTDRRPHGGLPGTTSSDAQHAVFHALR